MKNITVSIDEQTYRKARIKAAEEGTSVSALVREHLKKYISGEVDYGGLIVRERHIREGIKGFSVAECLSRDEIHDRRL